MTDASETLWDKVYSEKPHTLHGWYEPSPTRSIELIQELSVPLDSVMADVGCGQSNFISDLIQHGFRQIYAIDVSSTAMENLRGALGKDSLEVKFISADVSTKNFPSLDKKVDVWHDRTLLHFFTGEKERKQYRRNLLTNLRSGGYAIFAEHSRTGPEYCSGQKLFRYEADDYRLLLGNDFELIKVFKHDQPSPSGSVRNLTYAVFRKSC
ncbi:hypothetical protein IX51_08440 [uncultured archaeon]|nr:hypothetical protein IX51_08440 [uncultured archaeon]HKJ96380.1 class I SAM-dependent methyltransferase [Thermoplasmataceae archaeon]